MKANADKFNLLLSSVENCKAKIEDFIIRKSTEENLLAVKFDSNLSFENHVTSLCKKGKPEITRCERNITLHRLKKRQKHYVKSVKLRSFFWSEYGKTRSRKNSVFGHFPRSGS